MNGANHVTNADRAARFSGEKSSQNTYEKAKQARERERARAIKEGTIPDPNRRTTLAAATTLVGTCVDMCPEFERVEREFQHSVDKWELDPATGRIDPSRAVKTFHRPAAGDETPLPSDVRPPEMLKATLDYLIHDLLTNNPIETTHNFIRDRTRSIRQDFVLQHNNGALAIECHERIARLHILCLHEMRGMKDYTEHLELEQLRKVLQSLVEFYDDCHRDKRPAPNEAEFRAYHIIAHLRDPDVAHQLERQADHILDAPIVRTALDIHAVAQRNNFPRSRRTTNTEATQNLFSRVFSLVARPSTPFLLACLLEAHFVEIRKGALKALKNSILEALRPLEVRKITEMLGFNDDADTATFASACALNVIRDPESGDPIAIKLNKKAAFSESNPIPPSKSTRLVSSKRAGRSHRDYIDGIVPVTAETPLVPPSPVTPASTLYPFPPGRRPSAATNSTPTRLSTTPKSSPKTSLNPLAPSFSPVSRGAANGNGTGAGPAIAPAFASTSTSASAGASQQPISAFASASAKPSVFAAANGAFSAFAPTPASASTTNGTSIFGASNFFGPKPTPAHPQPAAIQTSFGSAASPAPSSSSAWPSSFSSASAPTPGAGPSSIPQLQAQPQAQQHNSGSGFVPTSNNNNPFAGLLSGTSAMPTPVPTPSPFSFPPPQQAATPAPVSSRSTSPSLLRRTSSLSRRGTQESDAVTTPLSPSSARRKSSTSSRVLQSQPQPVAGPSSFTAPPPRVASPETLASSSSFPSTSTLITTTPTISPADQKAALIASLTQHTYALMLSSQTSLLAASAVASTQHTRAILRVHMHKWIDRVIAKGKQRRLAREGRAEVRRAILSKSQSGSWGNGYEEEDGETLTPSRASSVYGGEGSASGSGSWSGRGRGRRERTAVEDDEYLRTLEQASATRTDLWARGSFLASIQFRLSSLSASTSTESAPKAQLPPHWSVWLSTANEDPDDATAQWLRRKLDMEHAGHPELPSLPSPSSSRSPPAPLKSLWCNVVGSGEEETVKSTESPGLIIFEASRAFDGAELSSLHAKWRPEFKRLQRLISCIPKGAGYAPALVLVFWIPEASQSPELRSAITHVINASLHKTAAIPVMFKDIEIVLLSSASTADASFATAVQALDLDVTGHFPPATSIVDALRPYAATWKAALQQGMQEVAPSPSLISSQNYATLFMRLTEALNAITTRAWQWISDSPDSPPPILPSFLEHEVTSLPQLYSLLTQYFQLPFFFASPVAESFKAELSNPANFRPHLLLPNILERLADTVVWDLALAYEQRPSDGRELDEDGPEHLAQYRKLLEDVVASLPPFEADPPLPPEPDIEAEAADEYVGRKRVASVEIPRNDDKRIRSSSALSVDSDGTQTTHGPAHRGASVASLLKAVREARAKHALTSSRSGSVGSVY